MIRLSLPQIDDTDIEAVNRVLRTGYLVQGAEVAAFEDSVRRVVGTDYTVAVANCTAALHLSLIALGVGEGDSVAVSAYSWLSSANVIELVGARPLFVDIDPATFNMDPNSLRAAIESAPALPIAVIAVDAFGSMAPLIEIESICDEFGVHLVEDAACSIGASLSGRPAGSWGRTGCFSFHPRKAVTTGEGGIVTTDNPEIASIVMSLRNHGLDPDANRPDFIRAGYNLRMTEFQAALGVSQMAKLEGLMEGRRHKAQLYNDLLVGTKIASPGPVNESHVFQSYVVSIPGLGAGGVGAVVKELENAGIQATIGTYNMPMTTFFRSKYGYEAGDFPGSDQAFASAVSLPLHHGLSDQDQRFVIDALHAGVEAVGG